MKQAATFFLAFMSVCASSLAQVKIGDNPGTISPGSVLELESTSKALTLPRMTTVQMQAIPSPLKGMIVFNLDSNCIYLYRNNNTWASISMGEGISWPYHSSDQQIGDSGNAKGIVALTGAGLQATGNYSHAEGLNSIAAGTHSWSYGLGDTATGNGSVAMGYQNNASGLYSLAFGLKNISAYQGSMAFGQENEDSGWVSFTVGLKNKINSGVSYSNGLGYMNKVLGGSSNNAMGENNSIANGRGNSALGYANNIAANFSSAMGASNDVLAGNSHIIAGENNTIYSGNGNSLFGQANTATGSYLGAIGRDNSVFYQSAVALGQGNKDSGWASIAGGNANIIHNNTQNNAAFGSANLVTRNPSLAQGVGGNATFTAGLNNYNSGNASVALGAVNRATNQYSLAANFSNISNSIGMSSFGHFNDTISASMGPSLEPGEMLFSIGNGPNAVNRRNSFTMLRNGFTTINASAETGPNIPRAELDIKGTGAMIVPVGTTAERPVTPVVGMIRFCTDCENGPVLQGYDGSNWVNL